MAVKYQLPTGKTIYISFEQWLNLTDDLEQELIARDAGIIIDDPFLDFNSKEEIIREVESTAKVKVEEIELPDLEDLSEEELNKIKEQFNID